QPDGQARHRQSIRDAGRRPDRPSPARGPRRLRRGREPLHERGGARVGGERDQARQPHGRDEARGGGAEPHPGDARGRDPGRGDGLRPHGGGGPARPREPAEGRRSRHLLHALVHGRGLVLLPAPRGLARPHGQAPSPSLRYPPVAAPPHVPPILRSKFIAGLVILVPIVVTVKALVWLFNYLDDLAQPLATTIIGRPIPGLGFVLTVGTIFLTGVLFSAK